MESIRFFGNRIRFEIKYVNLFNKNCSLKFWLVFFKMSFLKTHEEMNFHKVPQCVNAANFMHLEDYISLTRTRALEKKTRAFCRMEEQRERERMYYGDKTKMYADECSLQTEKLLCKNRKQSLGIFLYFIDLFYTDSTRFTRVIIILYKC